MEQHRNSISSIELTNLCLDKKMLTDLITLATYNKRKLLSLSSLSHSSDHYSYATCMSLSIIRFKGFHIKDAMKASALTCAEWYLSYHNLLKFVIKYKYFIATKCIWKCHLSHHVRLCMYKPQYCYVTITASVGLIQNNRYQSPSLLSGVLQSLRTYATNISAPSTHILSYPIDMVSTLSNS